MCPPLVCVHRGHKSLLSTVAFLRNSVVITSSVCSFSAYNNGRCSFLVVLSLSLSLWLLYNVTWPAGDIGAEEPLSNTDLAELAHLRSHLLQQHLFQYHWLLTGAWCTSVFLSVCVTVRSLCENRFIDLSPSLTENTQTSLLSLGPYTTCTGRGG
jgi:hypothetical protein